MFSLDSIAGDDLAGQVRDFSPDIVHAFHADHCGAIAAQVAKELSIPYIITITGTDLYRERPLSPRNEMKTLADASALVVFHENVGRKLSELIPSVEELVRVIPQGVLVPSIEADDGDPDRFTFLLPSGIRPVKNILFSFAPLEILWRRYPQIRLVIAGPVIDRSYGEEVLAAVAAHPFSSWSGEINHGKMPALYRDCKVVLNSSLSEGGMANSLLEGMAHCRTVLASDIEGNRSLVTDGDNGLLFSTAEQFVDKAERLIMDKSLRESLGENGRRYVIEQCRPEKEALAYLELYLKIK